MVYDKDYSSSKNTKKKASNAMPAGGDATVATVNTSEPGAKATTADAVLTETDIAAMSRSELRSLKRARGISANVSDEDLTALLTKKNTGGLSTVDMTALSSSAAAASPSDAVAGKPSRKRNARTEETIGSGDNVITAAVDSSSSAAAASASTSAAAPSIIPSMLTEELKMVLCVRKDLKMGIGKMCAQCAHAAVSAATYCSGKGKDTKVRRWYALWDEYCGSKKVAVGIPDLDAMDAVVAKANQLGLPNFVIHDAGRTQVEAGTATVVAVGPAPCSLVDQVTGSFKLL